MKIRFTHRPPYAVSASASNTALDCMRKWGLRYPGKIKFPPSDPMQIGIDTHDLVDRFYRLGIVPEGNSKPAVMARELLLGLPKPAPWIFSENTYYIEIEHNDVSVYFVAKIDILDFQANTVHDHKTTGNFKWALTPDGLQVDLQAIIYSAIAEMLGMVQPSVQWNYILRTGKPRKQIVKTQVVDLWPKMLKVFELGQYLTHLRYNHLNVEEYPQVLTACGMYGGCEYREKYCSISARDHILSMWYTK